MSTLDLTPIIQPILAASGVVISALLAIYVPKAIAALQAHNLITLTDQQRATVLGAVQTGAGVLETKLDQGVLNASHIEVANPAVLAQAQAAINAVPVAAGRLGLTIPDVARLIVGRVDTAAHGVTNTGLAVVGNGGTVA